MKMSRVSMRSANISGPSAMNSSQSSLTYALPFQLSAQLTSPHLTLYVTSDPYFQLLEYLGTQGSEETQRMELLIVKIFYSAFRVRSSLSLSLNRSLFCHQPRFCLSYAPIPLIFCSLRPLLLSAHLSPRQSHFSSDSMEFLPSSQTSL